MTTEAAVRLSPEAAVDELRTAARFIADPLLKEHAHLRELREDEHLASRGLHLLEDVEEAAHLAREPRILKAARGLEERGRIADLLELHDHLQHERIANEGVAAEVNRMHGALDHLVVKDDLLLAKQLPSKEGRFRYSRGFSPRGLPPICCHFGHEILSDATLVRQGMESPAVGTS